MRFLGLNGSSFAIDFIDLLGVRKIQHHLILSRGEDAQVGPFELLLLTIEIERDCASCFCCCWRCLVAGCSKLLLLLARLLRCG